MYLALTIYVGYMVVKETLLRLILSIFSDTLQNKTTTISLETTRNKRGLETTAIVSANTSESAGTSTTSSPTTEILSDDGNEFVDYSTDYPAEDDKPCYFLQDITNASVEILSKRCQRAISGKVIYRARRIISSRNV